MTATNDNKDVVSEEVSVQTPETVMTTATTDGVDVKELPHLDENNNNNDNDKKPETQQEVEEGGL